MKRLKIREDGRIVWTRRVTKGERGGPLISLPRALGWEGKLVEIELVSPREVIVRLVEDDKE